MSAQTIHQEWEKINRQVDDLRKQGISDEDDRVAPLLAMLVELECKAGLHYLGKRLIHHPRPKRTWRRWFRKQIFPIMGLLILLGTFIAKEWKQDSIKEQIDSVEEEKRLLESQDHLAELEDVAQHNATPDRIRLTALPDYVGAMRDYSHQAYERMVRYNQRLNTIQSFSFYGTVAKEPLDEKAQDEVSDAISMSPWKGSLDAVSNVSDLFKQVSALCQEEISRLALKNDQMSDDLEAAQNAISAISTPTTAPANVAKWNQDVQQRANRIDGYLREMSSHLDFLSLKLQAAMTSDLVKYNAMLLRWKYYGYFFYAIGWLLTLWARLTGVEGVDAAG